MGIFSGSSTGYHDGADDKQTIREMIIEFSKAFGRPVNDSVVPLTVTERELLGNLILEECVEYVCQGLGLKVMVSPDYAGESDLWAQTEHDENPFRAAIHCELREGAKYDPIESADGLGDMNVIINFNASWHGFDLDAVTREIHESNMSKLSEDGKPIINGIGTTTGRWLNELQDPTKPRGKILKGPNYRKPNIESVLRFSEEMCPGHTASDTDKKVCRHCGIHVDSLRPPEDDFHG
jgi:predicted HAD superfamily Cof-like phosphohydrolase